MLALVELCSVAGDINFPSLSSIPPLPLQSTQVDCTHLHFIVEGVYTLLETALPL